MDRDPMNRDSAIAIVEEHVQAPGLRRHMAAVEAAMRFYAERLGEDQDTWGLAGRLHDFDWEIHPTLEQHPRDGAAMLRQLDCPETVVTAILSHNTEGTGVDRERPIDFALLACDEITGLIIAAALIRPDKDVREVKLKSVKKRWKSRAFAAGVEREHVAEASEDFSRVCFDGDLDLWQHVENVLEAMQSAASELELDGALAQA